MIHKTYMGFVAAAAGTVDVITATYSPAPTALRDKMLLWFRATGANTSTTPTFSPNGLTARTIVKQGGQPLVAGDIPEANAIMEVVYDLANTRWELVNPRYESFVGSYTTVQIAALTGMTLRQRVFNTTDNDYEYYDGTRWVKEAHPKYKVYKALLTQTGTDAPVATVLENNLGGTVVWTRAGTGDYVATLSGAFVSGKTFLIPPKNFESSGIDSQFVDTGNTNELELLIFQNDDNTPVDEELLRSSIEIQVYY